MFFLPKRPGPGFDDRRLANRPSLQAGHVSLRIQKGCGRRTLWISFLFGLGDQITLITDFRNLMDLSLQPIDMPFFVS